MNLNALAIAATLLVAPFAAQASTVVYSASGSAFIDDSDPSDILADFFDEDFDDTDISITGGFTNGVAAADLIISDFDTGILLQSSSIVSANLATGLLTVVFGDLIVDASVANLFGSTATAIFTFDETSGDQGFFAFVNVEILSDAAQIPLPASLPLLLAGLGGIAAVRRRKT